MATRAHDNIEQLFADDSEIPAMWKTFEHRLIGDLHAYLYGIGGLIGSFVSRAERTLGRELTDDEYRQIEQYCIHELRASMRSALDTRPW